MTTTTSSNLTITNVRAELRAHGISFSKNSSGEFSVRLKGAGTDSAYFTTDLADARATGLSMAREYALAHAKARRVTGDDDEAKVEKLSIDLSDLSDVEVRELKKFFAFRAGVCADCNDFSGEVTHRQAFDDLVDALNRRTWVETARRLLLASGCSADDAPQASRDLAANYYPDSTPAEAVADVA